MWSRRRHGSSTRSTVCCNCRNRRRRAKCSSREYSRPRSSVCYGPSTASGRSRRNWSCRGWQYANLQERSARPAVSHGASTGDARHERDLVSNATTAKPHVVHWPAAGYCCWRRRIRAARGSRPPTHSAHRPDHRKTPARHHQRDRKRHSNTRAKSLKPASSRSSGMPATTATGKVSTSPSYPTVASWICIPTPPDDQNCRRLLFNGSVFRLFLYFGTLRLGLAQV